MPIYLMEKRIPGYEQPTHYALALVCEDTGNLLNHWPAEAGSGDLEKMIQAAKLARNTFHEPILLDRHEKTEAEWRGLSPSSELYRKLVAEGILRNGNK